jgi:hypothetical protein
MINMVTAIPDTSISNIVLLPAPIHSSLNFTKQEEFWNDGQATIAQHTWHVDGDDWLQRSDGKWINHLSRSSPPFLYDIPSVARRVFPHLSTENCSMPSHRICAVRKHPSAPVQFQSDSGANTSATDNIDVLENVVQIKPISINSAEKDSTPMSMTAVGRIPLIAMDGAVLRPICYFSADIDGTIISPDAVAREFRDQYSGFVKYCDIEKNRGYLTFIGRDIHKNATMPLISVNKLWFHDSSLISTVPSRISPTVAFPKPSDHSVIRKLSDAASYELWHQRLGHCGTSTMAIIHKHVQGVPKLKGNSFYRCPSCLAGKAGKHSHRTPKNTISPKPMPMPRTVSSNIKLLPGQHFSADFGFVRGTSFSYKDKDQRTQTSIDGKNSYLVLIDRCTRYHWIFVSSSKTPPLQFN